MLDRHVMDAKRTKGGPLEIADLAAMLDVLNIHVAVIAMSFARDASGNDNGLVKWAVDGVRAEMARLQAIVDGSQAIVNGS